MIDVISQELCVRCHGVSAMHMKKIGELLCRCIQLLRHRRYLLIDIQVLPSIRGRWSQGAEVIPYSCYKSFSRIVSTMRVI